MTDGNYLILVKNVGKLAYIYDQAGSSQSAILTTLAAAWKQMALGTVASWQDILAYSTYASALNASLVNGNLQAAIVNLAKQYLIDADVLSYFVHNPLAAGASVAQVVAALVSEMTTDSKTFTTDSSAGLVNFLEQVDAGASALPQSGSPTYADATYEVNTIL